MDFLFSYAVVNFIDLLKLNIYINEHVQICYLLRVFISP